jgi:hypothetical protein
MVPPGLRAPSRFVRPPRPAHRSLACSWNRHRRLFLSPVQFAGQQPLHRATIVIVCESPMAVDSALQKQRVAGGQGVAGAREV